MKFCSIYLSKCISTLNYLFQNVSIGADFLMAKSSDPCPLRFLYFLLDLGQGDRAHILIMFFEIYYFIYMSKQLNYLSTDTHSSQVAIFN